MQIENLPGKKIRNFPIVNNTLNIYYPSIVRAKPVKNLPAYMQHSNSGMAAPRIAAIKEKTIGKIYSGTTKITGVASIIIKFRKASGLTHGG